ncbi:MAG: class I SAM-dependent methyltransferase [Luminiphilus sp.]|jgi:predicted O-methyltransferase YrrM|nr:class I SAM-dependent methyltransferase [Luminiphilus sp.]
MATTEFEGVKGFLPIEEAEKLRQWAALGAQVGPMLEIGSYCGLSTLHLADIAREANTVVFAVDHHRGSEEHQVGEFFHDVALTDEAGNFDSLPEFRRNLKRYEAEEVVIPVVAPSTMTARYWTTPIGFLFIDGGHSLDAALADYRGWSSHLLRNGLLVIHDVFVNVAEGGQAPHAIWQLAKQSGLFEEVGSFQSLRALRRL